MVTPIVVATMTGRSGSTWMMELLGTSDVVVMEADYPHESLYLAYLLHLSRHVDQPASPAFSVEDMVRGDPYRFGPPPFGGSAVDRADLGPRVTCHLWMAFAESLEASAARRGSPRPRYWAEKFVVGAQRLATAGVAVRMIRLLRDPRDVVTSVLAFDAKRGFYGFGRKPGQSEEEYVRWLVGRMAARLDEMSAAVPGIEAVTVRYEDMVSNIDSVAALLGEWLGITLDPASLLPDAPPDHATSPSAKESVGRWLGSLEPRYVSIVNRALAPMLARYGYELEVTDG